MRASMQWVGRVVLTLLIVAGPSLSCAAPGNPRFENIGTEEGLPVTAVEALLQDQDGYMWFGTEAGLIRHDGSRFVYFRNVPGDAGTLGSNLVNALLEDRSGSIWVGTIGGLFRLNRERTHFDAVLPTEPDARGKGNRTIRDMRLGKGLDQNVIWVATADGLQRLDVRSGEFRHWHQGSAAAGGLGSDDVLALEMAGDGVLWVGTSMGFDRLDPRDGSVRHFTLSSDETGANTVTRLLLTDAGELWVGSKAGISRWSVSADGRQLATLPMPGKLDFDDTVRALFSEKGGAVWIGTQNSGVYRVDGDRVQHYRHRAEDPHSLADDSVVSILQDRSGTLWLGTWYNGLSRLELGSGGFERYTAVADPAYRLGDSLVYHVAADPAGGTWLGLLRGGIDHLDPVTGALRHFRHDPARPDGLPSDLVRCAVPDANGAVWVGTEQNGFGRLDPGSGRFTPVPLPAHPQELRSIRAIALASDGVVWIGSEGGLLRHDPVANSLHTFLHDPARADSLSQGRVLSLLIDSAGQVWAGTDTGLDRMIDPTGRFEHFQHDPLDVGSLSQSLVTDIHEDAQGRIWVGTGAGLDLLQRHADGSAGFQSFTVRDGLADDTIDAIEHDRQGRLWLSTDSGISRLDPATGEVRNYTERDGLPSGSFFVHSSTALPDGSLVFGGSHGAVSFHPEEIVENTVPPPVRITDLLVSGQAVRPGDRRAGVTLSEPIEFSRSLTLGPAVSDFTLEFAALHFADASRNRFAYQLEGFDREFILTDAHRPRATYTNLDPGNYRFHVRAANKDGYWNDVGAHLAITVLPPWWGTWWFRLSVFLVVAALLAWIYWRRIANLEANRQLLEASVRERTAELAEQTGRLERSLAQVEKTHHEVSLLGDLSAALQASVDIEAACERLAAFCPQLFPNSSGALYLDRADGERWVAGIRWGQPLPANLVPAHCRAVTEGRQVAHSTDSAATGCEHLHGMEDGATAAACIPLVAQGSMIGVLLIRHDDAPDDADARRRHAVAASMAEQTALALANLRLRSALLEQSVRDPLTGLFNRRRLLESLRNELARSRAGNLPLALLMIDIDHFKAYNDAHGHAAGDCVLQSVAETLQSCARRGDIVCRYGGEELAVLLPGAGIADAEAIAERMLDRVRHTAVSHDGRSLPAVTLSLGLAIHPDDGDSAEELLKASDEALYEAKAAGRDRIVVSRPKR
ncbi:MAG: diguanylate cyclase [Xanthomonadales bacterium]|nr:diguanylate cyclase [Xanthomonadales bacterium]